MSTALGIVVQPGSVSFALLSGKDLMEFGTIARLSGAGIIREYDAQLAEVIAAAHEAGAPVFLETPILYRDAATWPDFSARCEAVGEIGVHARAAGARVYRATKGSVVASLYRSQLGSKQFTNWTHNRARRLAATEVSDPQAWAIVLAEFGVAYLDGAVSPTLSPCAA